MTGSRLKRDTFTSIAPLQIISGQVSREIGSIDPSTILQETTSASGQQIDITYQGFVLPNGPGASTIDLRGLGDARTLVLHPATTTHSRLTREDMEAAGISEDMVRVSVGIEDIADIKADFARGFKAAERVAGGK